MADPFTGMNPFDRPIRTYGARLDPFMQSESGDPVYVDAFGNPIFFEKNEDYNPDAKPSLENAKRKISALGSGLRDTAGDLVGDPLGTITSGAQAAGEALYEGVTGTYNRLTSGNATLGDVFNVAGSIMGAGPATSIATKGVAETVSDITTPDPNTTRIFLTKETPGLTNEQNLKLDEAIDMSRDGDDALDIKKKTGWQKLLDEWVYEIDDSQAQTPKSNLKAKVKVDKEFTIPGGKLSPSEQKTAKLQAKQDLINLQKQLNSGAIDQTMFDDLLRARQDALTQELASTSTEKIVTKKVPLKLKNTGKLSEVLYHPELQKYGFMDKASGVVNKPNPKGNPGSQASYNPNSLTASVYKQAQDERSSLLHETQHFVDDISGSPNLGSNDADASSVLANATQRYKSEYNSLLKDPRIEDAREWLESVTSTDFDFDKLSLLVKKMKKDGEGDSLYPELDYSKFESALLDVGVDEDWARIVPGLLKDAQDSGKSLNENTFLTLPPAFERINKLNESRDARIAALKYSSSDPVHEVYRADRGEAKARAVQARRALTPEQRANSLVTNKDTGVPDWLTYSSNEYK